MINFINLTLFTTSFPRDDMIKLDERWEMIWLINIFNLSHNLPSYDHQLDLAAMRGVILSCWERWSIITTSSFWSLVICLSLLWWFLPSLIGWIDPCFLTHEYLTKYLDKMRDDKINILSHQSTYQPINLVAMTQALER